MANVQDGWLSLLTVYSPQVLPGHSNLVFLRSFAGGPFFFFEFKIQ